MAKLERKIEKRRYITKKDMLEVLQDCYQEMFLAYYEGIARYNEDIQTYIPEARTRLESAILNSRLTESFIKHFPSQWWKGRYGRIIFRWQGISLLIKKLNLNGKPSYIPTRLSDGIINQLQIPLFDCDEAKEDTILFFGYTKDKSGQLINPRIVLFDDGVQWVADASDIQTRQVAQPVQQANVRLKKSKVNKKAE